jgi:hypothetical protein
MQSVGKQIADTISTASKAGTDVPAMNAVAQTAAEKSTNAAGTSAVMEVTQSSPATPGNITTSRNLELTPSEGKAIFKAELARLQAEGKIPRQNWFMKTFFPQFRFRGEYAVQVDGLRQAGFDTLDAANQYAANRGRQVVGGFTSGEESWVFMSAALEASVSGIGQTTPGQTMRWVLLHELGHQLKAIGGGGCAGGASGEMCADSFAKKRF